MNAGAGFVLHPEAARDITQIWEFVARDNLIAAGRLREEILSTVRQLVAFPRQGHIRPDLTSRPLRFKLVRHYLIAYAPEAKPLLVLGVLHGRRDPRVMAAILRDRQ